MKRRMRIVVQLVGLLAIGPAAALAQVANGDFSSGLTGWDDYLIGDVSAPVDPGTGNQFALFAEPGAGSLSQIRQDFNLPSEPAASFLYFRYRFVYGDPPDPSAVPPDSFLAYLVDPQTGDRLVVPPANDPNFTDQPGFLKPFFYIDSNGVTLFDDTYVTVSDRPDGDGLFVVSLNVAPLAAGQAARVIFALNAANNDPNSVVILDDVRTECPPAWCCTPEGMPLPVDDHDPCTADECDADGLPVHIPIDPSGCCGQCNSTSANIVLVLDLTGSISDEDLQQEVSGARAFLSVFENGDPLPSVGIVTFNGPCPPGSSQTGCSTITDMARVEENLTDNYAVLYEFLEELPNRTRPDSAQTNLAQALDVAQSILPVPEDEYHPNYIVVISDGIPNIPDDECAVAYCDCASADAAAVTAKQIAEAAGTDIFAVHYEGNGYQCEGTGEPAAGAAFMRDSIATASEQDNFFIDGDTADIIGNSYHLICAFHGIVERVSCDDGDPDTLDCCHDGECAHGPACE